MLGLGWWQGVRGRVSVRVMANNSLRYEKNFNSLDLVRVTVTVSFCLLQVRIRVRLWVQVVTQTKMMLERRYRRVGCASVL